MRAVRMRRTWIVLGLALLLAGCSTPVPTESDVEMPERLDWDAMAQKIAQRLDPQPEEQMVLLVDGERFEELVPPLRAALSDREATILGTYDVEGPQMTEEQARELLGDVDAMIALPGPEPTDTLYAMMQERMRAGQGRMIHFHWEGAIPMPEGSLPPQEAIDAIYERALLETDYEGLDQIQREFEDAMRDSEIRVTTPAGTDLRFRIGDRPVTLQNGDASAQATGQGQVLIDREIELPPGAVRVAALEESVQGTIVFPPATWNEVSVGPVTLEFEDGQVTAVSSDNDEAVVAELDSNPAARYFREFALGFNPLLAIPETEAWIPYYGYGAGVVRLSLGDNTELGGNVSGGYVRWNFFTDATVSVGEEVWVEEGKLLR